MFVVIFHAFTGLQHRAWGYLYLVALVVFTSKPTPFPEGRFRRFVIRICGSTYNTARHLKMIPPFQACIVPGSIDEQIFLILIIWKWFPKPDYFQKFLVLPDKSGPCANAANVSRHCGTWQCFFASADCTKHNSRRKLSGSVRSWPDPAANRASPRFPGKGIFERVLIPPFHGPEQGSRIFFRAGARKMARVRHMYAP